MQSIAQCISYNIEGKKSDINPRYFKILLSSINCIDSDLSM